MVNKSIHFYKYKCNWFVGNCVPWQEK